MKTHDFICFGKTKLVFVRRELGDLWRKHRMHGYKEIKTEPSKAVLELTKALKQYELRCPWNGKQCFCSKLFPEAGFPWKVDNALPDRCKAQLSK